MGISEVLCIFFLITFSKMSAVANDCSISMCGSGENPAVRFPFRLDTQPEACGYPGFNLICDSTTNPVLNLPYMGDVFVREINYVKQEIHLYDRNDCLPKRLLDLNISQSHFKSIYYQNFTFFNCSSEFKEPNFAEIDCLSSKSFKVIAVPSMTPVSIFSTECEVVKTVPVPVPVQFSKNGRKVLSSLPKDLILYWNEPDCRNCESRGWECRLISNTSYHTGCFKGPIQGPSTNASNNYSVQNILTLGIVIPVLAIMLALCICLGFSDYFVFSHQRNRTSSLQASRIVSPEPSNVAMAGLDGITIDSYPKLIIGESCRTPTPNGSTCPICLLDYHSKEIIRCMPECKHCFHVACIDEWLLSNVTCPLCRNAPSQEPAL